MERDSMHPAVVKAKKLATIAVENNWTGSINSEVENGSRTTLLKANRKDGDESVEVTWINNQMHLALHSLMHGTVIYELPCAKAVSKVLTGWPDVMQLIKAAPDSRAEIVHRYRNLPFDWENDSDEEIISKVVGAQIFWYSHITTKIYSDVVLVPKKNKKTQVEIKPIGHRKSLHFIGAKAGFSSVLLDSIIKVG